MSVYRIASILILSMYSSVVYAVDPFATQTIPTVQIVFTVYDPTPAWKLELIEDLSVALFPMHENRTQILSVGPLSGGRSLVRLGFLAAPAAGNDPVTGTWLDELVNQFEDWKADPVNYTGSLRNGNITRFMDLLQSTPTQVPTTVFLCLASDKVWATECADTGPNPPDWGIVGIAIGLAVAFIGLFTCVIMVGLAYCRHEKKGPWAPLTRRKRLVGGQEAEREQVDHSKSNFKQQRFKYWTPELSPDVVLGFYVAVGVIFLIIGPVLYKNQDNVHEVYVRYDNLPECISAMSQNLNQPYDTDIQPVATPRGTCTVTILIEEEMPAPVFFYYRLTNFYQNHWRYVKSRDDKSNRNKGTSRSDCKPDISFGSGDITSSAPFLYPLNAAPNLLNQSFFVGKDLYPCGLVAQSWFNDKFVSPCVYSASSPTCEYLSGDDWNKTGIAWSRDLSKRFIPRPLDPSETNYNPRGFQMPPVNDEDFVVWMRQAPLPTFEKLNKRILNRGLRKGEILNVTVENNFPVHMWKGHKGILLATANSLGTKNFTLGAAFIVIGIFAIVIAVCFAIKIRLDTKWNPDAHLLDQDVSSSGATATS